MNARGRDIADGDSVRLARSVVTYVPGVLDGIAIPAGSVGRVVAVLPAGSVAGANYAGATVVFPRGVPGRPDPAPFVPLASLRRA